MNLDFEKLFKLSIFCTKMNRSHPDIPRDRKWLVQFVLMHGLYTLIFLLILYSIIFHDIRNGDFAKICGNGTLVVFYIVVTFKYSLMLWHQRSLKRLIKTMKSDYELAVHLSPEENGIVVEYANKGKSLIIPWLALVSCAAGLFPLKSLILMLYYTVVDQFTLVPIFDLTYPAVLEDVKDSVVPFALLYIAMNCYLVYAAFMYIGLVTFGPIFMQHACGQLELAKMRVSNLFPEHGYSPEKSKADLKAIVILLDNVYRFVEDIKQTFQLNYELTLKMTTITLPITFYQIIETYHSKGQLSLEFLTIFIACIAFSIYPCYYSDVLLGMGESVRTSVYTSGWENQCDLRARTSLLLLLTRTARPVAVRSLFSTLCLDTLTGVFQQAYRIFSVINAAWR